MIGVCGAFVAPLSGRFADRSGAKPVVLGGSLMVALSFVILWAAGTWSLVAITIGVLLIDIGMNGALIANQTRAYALVPGARGRINTVLFTTIFVFAALGAYAGSQAFLLVGWPASARSASPAPPWPSWSRYATAESGIPRGPQWGPGGKAPGLSLT